MLAFPTAAFDVAVITWQCFICPLHVVRVTTSKRKKEVQPDRKYTGLVQLVTQHDQASYRAPEMLEQGRTVVLKL